MGALVVSKEEFIRQADLICRAADEAQSRTVDAYEEKHKDFNKSGRRTYYTTLMKVVTLPSVKSQIRKLESLQAPAAEATKVGAIIAGWKAAVKEAEKDVFAAARWWVPARNPFTEISKASLAYGFWDCQDLR
jgi:hypothetical protein